MISLRNPLRSWTYQGRHRVAPVIEYPPPMSVSEIRQRWSDEALEREGYPDRITTGNAICSLLDVFCALEVMTEYPVTSTHHPPFLYASEVRELLA